MSIKKEKNSKQTHIILNTDCQRYTCFQHKHSQKENDTYQDISKLCNMLMILDYKI